jgi:hypothetical protein
MNATIKKKKKDELIFLYSTKTKYNSALRKGMIERDRWDSINYTFIENVQNVSVNSINCLLGAAPGLSLSP